MGISLRKIDGNQQRKYREAIHQMEKLFIYRLFRPWLYNDWIFSLVSKGREQREVIKILHGFTDQIIEERKLYHERTNNRFLKNFDNFTKAEADDAEMIGIKRKQLALLDLLIAAFQEGTLTNLNIKEEVDTFMFGGHDTSTIAISFLLALLAEHKDIQ
ncbi:PREDICTED: cytochrome P450 4C1-like, partial [Wasmannia auropunctata]|uniref:cytochrome P450 4C1-like n=1 Tax=Wasmannia auropunctata TaxID=64793 RepID=UPI0005EF45C8